jgi:hypothetical protein
MFYQVSHFFQIANELTSLLLAGFAVGRAQDRGRMRRRHNVGGERTIHQRSAVAGHTKIPTEQSLRGARSETHQDFWLHYLQLRIEPGSAGFDLRLPRLLVDPPLPPVRSSPLEMLDNISDVDFGAINPDFPQHFIEQPSSGAHKRMPGFIFGVARLLTDEHYSSGRRTFPKNGLPSISPEIAGFASASSILQIGECRGQMYQACGRSHPSTA